MVIILCWGARSRYAKKDGRFRARRFDPPADLLTAIEFGDDGTSRDETLRVFAQELLRVGLVKHDELFIGSYDVIHDRETFFFCGYRAWRR